jgi:hypothetical protein
MTCETLSARAGHRSGGRAAARTPSRRPARAFVENVDRSCRAANARPTGRLRPPSSRASSCLDRAIASRASTELWSSAVTRSVIVKTPPGISSADFETLASLLAREDRRRGRPWIDPLRKRLWLVCTALRTNLTLREIATLFDVSKSRAHRIVADLTRRIARMLGRVRDLSRRFAWAVDGTLIPTRDHRVAAKSKNYRYSCNVQVLARGRDLQIIDVDGGGPGNRNDPVHYRGSKLQAPLPEARARAGRWRLSRRATPRHAGSSGVTESCETPRARVEHAIARQKDWRVLRDHRRRAGTLMDTVRAVAVLHNLRTMGWRELRDNS